MNCPICNKELQPTDTFCPGCGFEIHILPNEVSPEIEAYERERERKYREKLEKYQNEIKEKEQEHERKEKDLSEQLSSSQKELENQKKEAEAKATSDQATKDQLTKKIDELTKDLEQRSQELDEAKTTSSKLQEESRQLETNLRTQIDSLNSQMETAETKSKSDLAQIEQLKKDLEQRTEELNAANRKIAGRKEERPKAFILLKGVGEETVGAVYQGRNSYGCQFGGIDDPNHQELSLNGLKPLHFRIETVGDRFLLLDVVGDIIYNGEPVGSKGHTLTNHCRFSIGKDIKVSFIIS